MKHNELATQAKSSSLPKLIFVCVLFFALFPSYGQIFERQKQDNLLSDFHLSIEPKISYTTGFLGEILYRSNPKDKKISFLEWDKKLFLFGANLHSSYKNLHLEFGVASSLFKQPSGDMQDSDWLNENDYFMKTTYSVGENKAVENFDADFQISYDFNTTDWLTFSPILSARYSYDSFKREDAEGWYSDGQHWWYDESSTHYPYSYWNEEKGRYVTLKLGGIDYFRKSLFTFVGFRTKIKPLSRLTFNFDILLSPFSYFYAIDSHTAQDSTTKEKFKKHYRMIQYSYLNILSLGFGANFSINKIFDISLKTNYLFSMEITRGTLHADYFLNSRQDDFYNTGQNSGVSLENFTVTLGLKVKIL